MQQPGVIREMGGKDFKWEAGHHCPPPAGDDPGFIVKKVTALKQ